MSSGLLPHLIPTSVCSDSELWYCVLLLSSVNEESSSALFQCQTPAKFQKKFAVILNTLNGHSNTKRHAQVGALFIHGSMHECLCIGIGAEKHDLYSLGEQFGSIIVITSNRNFLGHFQSLKETFTNAHECCWNIDGQKTWFLKSGKWSKGSCDSNKANSSSNVLVAVAPFC